MKNDEIENIDSKIDETVEDTTPEEEINEDETEETQEEESDESDNNEKLTALEKKVKELEAQKNHWKTKASKKAEVKTEDGLSQNDLYALIKNDVHEDDIDEVVEYSKLKKISVKEALQSGVVKAILKEKEETRQTAQVANTGTSRKSNTSKDVDTLVTKARKGELPQSPEEMKKVFERMKGIDRLEK